MLLHHNMAVSRIYGASAVEHGLQQYRLCASNETPPLKKYGTVEGMGMREEEQLLHISYCAKFCFPPPRFERIWRVVYFTCACSASQHT